MLGVGEIFFNGYNSLHDLHLKMKDYADIELINEEYESVTIGGRNGDLIYNLGTYPNRNITIDFDLVTKDYYKDYAFVEQWLNNITDNRLVLDNSGKCYRVLKVTRSSIKQEDYKTFNIPLTFLCEPFITDYEPLESIYTTNNIITPYTGTQEGEPIIELYGMGDIEITTNGDTMVIANVDNYVKIDSELMEVVDINNNSKDWDSIGNFPVFYYGENKINITGDVNKVKISVINKYK